MQTTSPALLLHRVKGAARVYVWVPFAMDPETGTEVGMYVWGTKSDIKEALKGLSYDLKCGYRYDADLDYLYIKMPDAH